jgi:uncharacterized protein (TIGR02145 family)
MLKFVADYSMNKKNKTRLIITTLLLTWLYSGLLAQNPKILPSTMTDFRDKKTYKTVTIGSQTWFAQNLNYAIKNSWCYNDTAAYCTQYGRLYIFDAAKVACPPGWALPTTDDWLKLVNTLGGKKVAGGKMKQPGTDFWLEPNDGADNSSALNMLPAGMRSYPDDTYGKLGKEAAYWSASSFENSDVYGWILFLDYASNAAFTDNLTLTDKRSALSVRCIKTIAPPVR